MNELPEREVAVFNAARRLTAKERAAYLDKACASDAALRRRVEELLQVSETSAHFLEQPALAEPAAPAGAGGTGRLSVALSEKPGDQIGRYKLLQQIGEGGCGVVYMAEQHEPVRRRVALKVIKLGMDTKSVIARFEAERQALAIMDHPNIAKVFDGGATEAGRPYFVMELVRGLKITDYCDEKKLSTRERLDLFMQVCQAIQHAHQKGIIHRDIKPSNVLVTVNDGVPVPKVIDFGIAKATTGQQLTDKTVFTAFEQFIGTPAYMSPEQAVLTSLDIDTRSDIYALGVLLYELLTGRTPFETAELLAIGLDEMRRTIREKEPSRPSTRVSTMPHNELSTTAQRRGLDAPKLLSELRGDLDWIVMKALEKDRARRYETANGLVLDIQRHLSNEPVLACPPSALYRLQKLARRNKLAFAAAGAVGISLVAGLAVSTVLYVSAKQQRDQAVKQRQRADEQAAVATAVTDFLQNDLLKQADMLNQANNGFEPNPNLTVKEALVRASENIDQRFARQPLVEAEIRQTLGIAFRGIGEPTAAVPHLERAVALYTQLFGPRDVRTLRAMLPLGDAYLDAGRSDDAASTWDKTFKLEQATLGPSDPDTLRTAAQVARRMRWSDNQSDWDASVAMYKETIRLQTLRLGADHPDTLETMSWLAYTYGLRGEPEKEIQLLQEILSLARGKFGSRHPYTLKAMQRLGFAYVNATRPEEAIKILTEALKGSKSASTLSFFSMNPNPIKIMFLLADAYRDSGKLDDEKRTRHDILTWALEAQPQNRDQRAWRASVFAWLGQWKEAAADTSKVIDLNEGDCWAWMRLGLALVEAGDFEGYREQCAKALKRLANPTDPCVALCVAEDCLVLPGSGADPETVARLADIAASDPPKHWAWDWCQLCKSLSEYRQGRFAKAEDYAQLVLSRPFDPEDHGRNMDVHIHAQAVLAMACWQLGQKDLAQTALAKSMESAKSVQRVREGISFGTDWGWWLVAQGSLREARTLIEGGKQTRNETN
jgi:eukaryotic-like serine/threonine-protein kinase